MIKRYINQLPMNDGFPKNENDYYFHYDPSTLIKVDSLDFEKYSKDIQECLENIFINEMTQTTLANTTNLSNFFDSNNFSFAGKIIQAKDGQQHTFKLEPDFEANGKKGTDYGWVYVWIGVHPNNQLEPLYVGKAGKTFHKRCGEHKQGFYTSVTGKKNAQKINDFYSSNAISEIHVYVRHSEFGEKFGVECISMCEFEEVALIKKFKLDGFKLWNYIEKE